MSKAADWVWALKKELETNLGRPLRPGELAQALGSHETGEAFVPMPAPVYDEADPYLQFRGPPVSVYLGFFGSPEKADYLKIGVARNVYKRMSQHRSSNPMFCVLTLSAEFIDRSEALAVEAALLKHMRGDRANGEWVNCKASIDACRSIAESLAEVAVATVGRPVTFAEAVA